jgi:hypothetical protein
MNIEIFIRFDSFKKYKTKILNEANKINIKGIIYKTNMEEVIEKDDFSYYDYNKLVFINDKNYPNFIQFIKKFCFILKESSFSGCPNWNNFQILQTMCNKKTLNFVNKKKLLSISSGSVDYYKNTLNLKTNINENKDIHKFTRKRSISLSSNSNFSSKTDDYYIVHNSNDVKTLKREFFNFKSLKKNFKFIFI